MDSFDLFISLQNNLCADVLREIFGHDWQHYERKWKVSNENFLYFMTMLDDDNKKKVLNWGTNNYYYLIDR